MFTKTGIVDDTIARYKQRSALTDEEIFQLMQAYTADKSCITEDEVMTFLHWAQHCKLLAHTLELVLAGALRVVVEGEAVKVGLRG